jgi:hypothetical protein
MALQTTTSRPAFGRRTTPQAQAAPPKPAVRAAQPVATPAPAVITAGVPQDVSFDHELQAWKKSRGSNFNIPWRQVYLMASLCFGIASFVLPDSVNDDVDYLLWGLMAMSAYAWFASRKKKTAAGP